MSRIDEKNKQRPEKCRAFLYAYVDALEELNALHVVLMTLAYRAGGRAAVHENQSVTEKLSGTIGRMYQIAAHIINETP